MASSTAFPLHRGRRVFTVLDRDDVACLGFVVEMQLGLTNFQLPQHRFDALLN